MESKEETSRKLIDFILEIDKLKEIPRRNVRRNTGVPESSAEHSWHLAVMVLLLSESAPSGVDFLRAVQMALIHDLPEVFAGDTFCFDDAEKATQSARESAAAEKLFGILPPRCGSILMSVWEEFEACRTPTSKYVNAIDRLHPLLQSYVPHRRRIVEKLTREEYEVRMLPIKDGLPAWWAWVQEDIDNALFTNA